MQVNSHETQQILDEEHLKLLALFHWISGGVTLAFSSIFILQLIFMGTFFVNPELQLHGNVDPETQAANLQFMRMFFGIFATFVILGIVYGILKVISGFYIRARKHRLFSFIVIIPSLVFIPYGTVLAVLTFIVLDRQSVKMLYESK